MLKKLFNNEIKKLGSTKIGEVRLFECLERALQYYPSIKTHICHQKYVKHVNQCYMRELCDLFVLVIHEDYLRYSFVQNKYSRRKTYNGLSDFTINCGQHRILVEKPQIQIVGTHIVSDILSLSKYDTITAYSVFYKDANGDYDFDFASANSVQCRNANVFIGCKKGGSVAKHDFSSIHLNNKNQEIDYDSLLNISEVESYPEFGEVIYFGKNGNTPSCQGPNPNPKLLLEFVSQFDLSEDVKAVLKKCNLEIANDDNLNYAEKYLNDKNHTQDLTQQYYVRKMLVIDLTNMSAEYNDLREKKE